MHIKTGEIKLYLCQETNGTYKNCLFHILAINNWKINYFKVPSNNMEDNILVKHLEMNLMKRVQDLLTENY